jgi:hypothetical protein
MIEVIMAILKLEQDFYGLFDKIGEGVMYRYEVHYDLSQIIMNDINSDNFKFVQIGISDNSVKYLNRYSIDKNEWEKAMLEKLIKDDMASIKEQFFEEISNEEYEEYEAKKKKM